jgi:phage shock protein PspC (stress-responsive transcriptional regulator)
MIAGVCGGLGEYFDVDPLIFRLIFAVMIIFGGTGVLAYIILWILIPEDNEQRNIKDLGENIKKGANKMAQEIKDTDVHSNSRFVAGAIILTIGVIFLINNFFPFFGLGVKKLWPLIIIVVGGSILLNPKRRD